MSESIKQCIMNAAQTINSIAANKREIAARLAETYAAGLAVGMELAEEGTKKEEGAEDPQSSRRNTHRYGKKG